MIAAGIGTILIYFPRFFEVDDDIPTIMILQSQRCESVLKSQVGLFYIFICICHLSVTCSVLNHPH